MAKIIRRVWSSRGPTGKRVRHVSYGYDVRIAGKRERTVSAEWITEDAAHEALKQRLKDVERGSAWRPDDTSLGALAAEYLRYKTDKGKRSLREDRRILKTRLLPAFTSELPAKRLSETLIAQYERQAPRGAHQPGRLRRSAGPGTHARGQGRPRLQAPRRGGLGPNPHRVHGRP